MLFTIDPEPASNPQPVKQLSGFAVQRDGLRVFAGFEQAMQATLSLLKAFSVSSPLSKCPGTTSDVFEWPDEVALQSFL